jgi:hypothetical protein
MVRCLSALLVSIALAPRVVQPALSATDGVNLAEFVRPCERIVLGRVERIVNFDRSPRNLRSDREDPPCEPRRWTGMPSIPFAELAIEKVFRGRVRSASAWFVACIGWGDARVNVEAGDRLLLCFGDRAWFQYELDDCGKRMREMGIDLVEDVAFTGLGALRITKDGDPIIRIPSIVTLPTDLWPGPTDDRWEIEVSWKRFEPVLESTLSAQLPIVFAFDAHDWKVRIYGDGRCVVTTGPWNRRATQSFDVRPERKRWLARTLELARYFDLPESMGESSPDDSDCQGIDVVRADRSHSVRIWDASSPMFICRDETMQRALGLMDALHGLVREERAAASESEGSGIERRRPDSERR